ncbi:MAG TPA: septum formation initiator family protein [Actinomycetota bacterium]|jgi:cell division protein FtsB|nr:septum formation initiator family protein [Actinomycetota bacterium]
MSTSLGRRRLFVGVTVVVAAFILFFPARALVSQRDRIELLEERRDALRAENRRLAAEASRLSDPAELEVLARDRLGLVRPGERAYFVEPTKSPDTATAEASRSMWSRAWTWLKTLVRGDG